MDAAPAPIEQHLKSLGYEELPPFVIIDEHSHQRSDGKGWEVFDRPRLERLSAKLNGKARHQNQPLPVIVGHTTPGLPEDKLPGIRGWCTRFQVGDFYDEHGRKKSAIYGVPFAAPGEKETFRKFPHRSIELWTGGETGDDIHPLALLGPTAPRRNLGVHLFSRDDQPGRYHYSRGVDVDNNFSFLGGNPAQQQPATGSSAGLRVGDMTVDQLAQAMAPALAKSQEFAPLMGLQDQISQLLQNDGSEWEPGGMGQDMDGMGGMGGMDPSMMGQGGMGGYDPQMMAMAGGGGGMQGQGYGQPYPQQFSRAGGYYQPPQVPYFPRPLPQRQPQRFSRVHLAQYAPTSQAAAELPAVYQPPAGTKIQAVPIPELPPNDPYKAHFDRLTALLTPLVEKVTTQEKNATLGAVIDRDLTTLATQHRVKFDYARERETLLNLPDDQARAEHFTRMKDNYARLDYGAPPVVPAPQLPVPGYAQAGTPNPAPQYGHQLTVGAMLPGQAGAPIPSYFSRPGLAASAERASDEGALPPGMDAFTLAANARANKMDVPTYLGHLRQAGAGQQNGQPEKVR